MSYISTANRIRDPEGLETGFCFKGTSYGYNEQVPNPNQICSCYQPTCTCAKEINVPTAVFAVKSNDVSWGLGITMLVIAIIWAILGIAGLIMSIMCFARSPKEMGLNIGGLLMAIFLGPFYWIYFLALKGQGYCINKK